MAKSEQIESCHPISSMTFIEFYLAYECYLKNKISENDKQDKPFKSGFLSLLKFVLNSNFSIKDFLMLHFLSGVIYFGTMGIHIGLIKCGVLN